MTHTVALRWATDLLFPRPCAGCDTPLPTGRPGEFCTVCTMALPWLRAPICAVCGDAFQVSASQDAGAFAERTCLRCREDRPKFSVARAAFRYTGPARQAVHRLKFDGRKALGPGLADLMLDGLGPEVTTDLDLVIPVPLHPDRSRERGYNQAEVLATRLAARLARPLAPRALLRVRATPPQVGLDRPARLANLRDAFAPGPDPVAGRDLLLVDDVLTTGATGSACARTLLAAGAARVRLAAFARD